MSIIHDKSTLELVAPVVILADGEFPVHPIPLALIESAGTVVCCDGAAEKLCRYGQAPDYIVGDLDSLSGAMKDQFYDRLFAEETQETNDLTKAVEFCLNHGVTRLKILGATGLREDHAIANISLLADYAAQCDVEMLTNYGTFTAITTTGTLAGYAGQQVSIFSLTPATVISFQGLKYPLTEQRLDSWWKGTLNEALGDSFTITFEEGKIIVFRAF